MEEGRTKVAIASSYPVVVEGFRAMLARHPNLVVVTLSDSIEDEEPDVVLYDVVGLADGDGADLDLLVKRTACIVLAVSRDLRPDLLGQALTHGADGFISLSANEEDLVAAIASASTGWEPGDTGPNPVVGSSDTEQRAQRLGSDAGLSNRETRVLSLIAQGLSNEEIAARDFLSVNSVKSYIRTAYRKIGVRSRTQAVAWAVQHGFSTDEDSSVYRPHDNR